MTNIDQHAKIEKQIALDALIAAINDGHADYQYAATAFPSESAYGKCNWHLVMRSYEGSLDAAKDLHEALLPDWRVKTIHQFEAKQWYVSILRQMGSMWPKWEPYPETQAVNDIASRAWLLAILSAYKTTLPA